MTDSSIPHALSDFHIHATAGRGKDPRMTVANIVARERELGRSSIGILEHLAPQRSRPIEILERIRDEIERIEDAGGLRVYFSAELEADEDGSVRGPPDVRERLGLDYAIAAVHLTSTNLDPADWPADHLRMMLALLKGPVRFEVMAHPWRSMLSQMRKDFGIQPGFNVVPHSMQAELIDACRRRDVAIEVNAGSPLDDPAHDAFLRRAADAGLRLAPGSDAHHFESLDHADRCAGALRRIGVDADALWHPDSRLWEGDKPPL